MKIKPDATVSSFPDFLSGINNNSHKNIIYMGAI